MLWFWGTIGLILAVVFIGAWFYDRKRGFDLTHRDRARYDGAQADRSHASRDVQAGNWGGFGGGPDGGST